MISQEKIIFKKTKPTRLKTKPSIFHGSIDLKNQYLSLKLFLKNTKPCWQGNELPNALSWRKLHCRDTFSWCRVEFNISEFPLQSQGKGSMGSETGCRWKEHCHSWALFVIRGQVVKFKGTQTLILPQAAFKFSVGVCIGLTPKPKSQPLVLC